jgi:CheY-like chemotaxis protein
VKVYSSHGGVALIKRAEVLVVDDDPNDAFFLRRAFSQDGLRASVWVAVDGGEARTRLTPPSVKPDLMILDLSLPDEDGLSVLRWLKTEPELKSLPVIVLTASGDPKDRERALALGAAAYMVKPVEWLELATLTHSLASHAFPPMSGDRLRGLPPG